VRGDLRSAQDGFVDEVKNRKTKDQGGALVGGNDSQQKFSKNPNVMVWKNPGQWLGWKGGWTEG